jgi:replicative DNA helicase
LLANNKAYERVAEFLIPEHFADPIYGRIYQAIARRIEAGQLADAVTLKAEFEHSGVLEEAGGTAYLAQRSPPWLASLMLASMAGRFTTPGCAGS